MEALELERTASVAATSTTGGWRAVGSTTGSTAKASPGRSYRPSSPSSSRRNFGFTTSIRRCCNRRWPISSAPISISSRAGLSFPSSRKRKRRDSRFVSRSGCGLGTDRVLYLLLDEVEARDGYPLFSPVCIPTGNLYLYPPGKPETERLPTDPRSTNGDRPPRPSLGSSTDGALPRAQNSEVPRAAAGDQGNRCRAARCAPSYRGIMFAPREWLPFNNGRVYRAEHCGLAP